MSGSNTKSADRRRKGSGGCPVGQDANASVEYWIEAIIDKKLDTNGVWKYLVKWYGYESEQNTWEPVEHLSGCKKMLAAFESKWGLEKEKADTEKAAAKVQESGGKIQESGGKADGQVHEVESSTSESSESETESSDKTTESDTDKGSDGEQTDKDNFVEFDVLEKCPSKQILSKILYVVNFDGPLIFLVEWKPRPGASLEEGEVFVPERCLVKAEVLNESYPEKVIAYYESRAEFTGENRRPAISNVNVVVKLDPDIKSEVKDEVKDKGEDEEDDHASP